MHVYRGYFNVTFQCDTCTLTRVQSCESTHGRAVTQYSLVGRRRSFSFVVSFLVVTMGCCTHSSGLSCCKALVKALHPKKHSVLGTLTQNVMPPRAELCSWCMGKLHTSSCRFAGVSTNLWPAVIQRLHFAVAVLHGDAEVRCGHLTMRVDVIPTPTGRANFGRGQHFIWRAARYVCVCAGVISQALAVLWVVPALMLVRWRL